MYTICYYNLNEFVLFPLSVFCCELSSDVYEGYQSPTDYNPRITTRSLFLLSLVLQGNNAGCHSDAQVLKDQKNEQHTLNA